MRSTRDLTAQDLQRVFRYDRETGVLTRLRSGKAAGYMTTAGRFVVEPLPDTAAMSVGRVCWILHAGEVPLLRVVHLNGDQRDNRFCNLRLGTASDSNAIAQPRSNNRSGFKGVHWQESRSRWVASIQRDGKKRQLGRYLTREEAHRAYIKAAGELHGEFARLAGPEN
jgi:hypothetical protein